MLSLTLDDRGVVATCANCGQKVRTAYERLGSGARCARCKADLPPPGAPIEVPSAALFDALVSKSALPVVVDYWAPWCGPCRVVAPELAKVAAARRGEILVAKVNTEAMPDIAARYRIQSIPTMAIFVNGREAARTVGARPASGIEAFLADALRRESRA